MSATFVYWPLVTHFAFPFAVGMNWQDIYLRSISVYALILAACRLLENNLPAFLLFPSFLPISHFTLIYI